MNALTSSSSNAALDQFGIAVPRELRQHAAALSFADFRDRFTGARGPIRLGSWSTAPARGGRTTFEATFGLADSIHSATASAYGPIDALTSMLYDAGFHIEIISFHQQTMRDGRTATFVQCECGGRTEWAFAASDSGAESSIRAIIGAANMLHC